ncbi:hypothetical protein AALO_G00050860, partial [Alosa alosa]
MADREKLTFVLFLKRQFDCQYSSLLCLYKPIRDGKTMYKIRHCYPSPSVWTHPHQCHVRSHLFQNHLSQTRLFQTHLFQTRLFRSHLFQNHLFQTRLFRTHLSQTRHLPQSLGPCHLLHQLLRRRPGLPRPSASPLPPCPSPASPAAPGLASPGPPRRLQPALS